MKNTLTDLNNHLFAQLERLGDEDLTKDKLDLEIERTKSLTVIAREVISNARLLLDGYKAASQGLVSSDIEKPKLLQ